MEDTQLASFNVQLLKSIDNPFRYPHPPARPPFVVGGEYVIDWFKSRYRESIGQGSKISFIVGVPGAGKSHVLSHLKYLFYDAQERIRGIYAVYDARGEEIDEKDLWINFFWGEDVLDTLKQIVDVTRVKNSKIPLPIQNNLIKLLEGQLDYGALDSKSLHNMAEGLSKLLVKENAGICIAIDNIDEYFRVMTQKYQEKYTKEEARDRVAASLLGAIRVATAGLEQIVVLLACTEDVQRQISEARVDVTYGRRVEVQQKKLQELSPHQSIDLANRYLDWWAQTHGTKLPTVEDDECSLVDSRGEKISVYPFSIKAVEYFHKVTRAMPGDIVCLCGQCINDMRREGGISVVKGAAIHYALEEAKKIHPQLVLKTEIIENERPLYMKELMDKRLALILKEFKSVGSDSTRIINVIESYGEAFGIGKTTLPSAKRYTDEARSIPLGSNSKIWEYKSKRIFVKYIIGPYPPLGEHGREFGFGKEIESQDWIEALSFLQDESTRVTHVLFIIRWAKPLMGSQRKFGSGMEKFRSVVAEVNVDDIIDKVAAVVEDTSEHRKDLINHVEYAMLNAASLVATLDSLTEREKSERSLEAIRKADKETATAF